LEKNTRIWVDIGTNSAPRGYKWIGYGTPADLKTEPKPESILLMSAGQAYARAGCRKYGTPTLVGPGETGYRRRR
jgi:hypothetical protein